MYATEYVKSAPAFGKTIADFQGIQWEIAKCAVDIEAARLLTYRAAWLADQGRFTKEWVPMLSMAKYYATELAVRASGLAVQLLGAAGYMEDHPTELWYRDAQQLTIVEGTSQVQLGLIARGVLDARPVVGLSGGPVASSSAGQHGVARHPVGRTSQGRSTSSPGRLAGGAVAAHRRDDLTRPRHRGVRRDPRRCGDARTDRRVRRGAAHQGRDRRGDDRLRAGDAGPRRAAVDRRR